MNQRLPSEAQPKGKPFPPEPASPDSLSNVSVPRAGYGRPGAPFLNTALASGNLPTRALVAALPLLGLARASGQEENYVGYRHEWYNEDDQRMNIGTDTAAFNVKLSQLLSVNGQVVFDAISGATPNGAPPQSQWPFPTYANLYANAFKQAYPGQFNSYIADNLIYADAGYITYQQLTNDARAFALTNTVPIASNSASASFHALTNNPNYHNTTVPLTQMHDRRSAFALNLPITLGIHQITPTLAFSEESDYLSWSGALNYAAALNGKNTTLSAGWAHNADRVRDYRFVWEDKTTDDLFAGVVQLLSPKSYITVNGTLGWERGYLSDPYRGVMLETMPQLNPDDPALSAEQRPDRRNKQLLFASWNQFVTPLRGGVELSYRFFHDSYGIFAHTVECDWHQKLGKNFVLTPTFRYYVQSAADFYYVLVPDYFDPRSNTYKPQPQYYSSDYRLSNLQTFAGGFTISWRLGRYMSVDASYLRYVMEGLDGVTSPSAYPSANVYTAGLRVWF
jgi:hypothetical protein